MNARKKLREIMAGKRLVLMPGAYDAMSARIIEAEGFEGVVAGGYAAVGSMLAQPEMMRLDNNRSGISASPAAPYANRRQARPAV